MSFSVCIYVLFIVNGCNFIIKILKPSMTEQGFFFFFSFQWLLCLIWIFKMRGILYIKEENFDCKYVSSKNTDYIFLVYRLAKWCILKSQILLTLSGTYAFLEYTFLRQKSCLWGFTLFDAGSINLFWREINNKVC